MCFFVYYKVHEYHKRVVEYEEDDESKLIENVKVTHVRAIQSVSIQQDNMRFVMNFKT